MQRTLKGGNWHRTSEWSKETRENTNLLIAIANNGVRRGEIVFNYNDDAQYKRLIDALMDDVFDFDIMPNEEKKLIQEEGAMRCYEDKLRQALSKYGKMNILYFEDKANADVFPENLTVIYEDERSQVLLTPEKEGMPIKEFLLFYKGEEEPNRAAISEWSGIPRDSLEHVYKMVVRLFYNYFKTTA